MRLTMYLLRDGATADEGSLRSRPGMRPIPVRNSFESIAGVFLLSGEIKQPGWLTELAEISDLDLDDESFQGQSHGAVVLVERQGRIAAVTFGTGFHAIDPSLIERGFGLRVTANVVAAGKIRGAQTRGVASNSRDQKTLLPVDGEFNELDVEVDEDWLRQLSGKSADQAFAMSLAGSDSLRITVRDFSLKAISAKVDQVLTLYKGVEYRKKFPFLDQITPIDRADPVIERLDELVTAQLRGHEPTIAFASPDPFERDEQFDHYELTCGYHGRFIVDDLDNDAVFSVIDQLGESRDPLTDIRVFALDADGELVDSVHTLKSYVQTEVQLDETDFLLSAGLWFLIRKDFSAKVHEQIANIPDLTDELTESAWV